MVTANDYYPGGMLMPGRRYSSTNGYRYGFNGKEKDNSTGEGNLDFGARIYDDRLGRFFTPDPLAQKYSWLSPYLFSLDNPIKFIDFEGMSGDDPGDPKALAKAYLEKTVKPYIAMYSSYKQFTNIQPQMLIKELEDFVRDPGSLKEHKEVSMECGIYAFGYAYAIMEPSKFIQNVSDMYITGRMGTNGWETTINKNSAEAKGIEGTQSLPIYIFAGSIRDRENNFLNRTGFNGNNKFWGSTSHASMKHWLTDMLGAKVTEFDYGHEYFGAGVTNKDLSTLSEHLNKGNIAMVLVSFDGYTQLSDNGKIGKVSQTTGKMFGGDHWIVLNGSMTIDGKKGTVTFTSYDVHKGNQTIKSSISDFQSMTNQVMMIEKKVEKK